MFLDYTRINGFRRFLLREMQICDTYKAANLKLRPSRIYSHALGASTLQNYEFACTQKLILDWKKQAGNSCDRIDTW